LFYRQVIYKFDMFHFNELVKNFEIGAYEKLSINVHLQLNHEKRRKPKKQLLQPETGKLWKPIMLKLETNKLCNYLLLTVTVLESDTAKM
jgi:hypothetical protein